jgi:hypothetical protein
VEPEETAVARLRPDKHVPAATNTYATMEELLVALFSTWPVPSLYNEDENRSQFATLNKANPDIESIRGLNLVAVKHTTVEVTRPPF